MKEKISDFDPKSPLYLKPIAPKKKATHSYGRKLRPGTRGVRTRQFCPYMFKMLSIHFSMSFDCCPPNGNQEADTSIRAQLFKGRITLSSGLQLTKRTVLSTVQRFIQWIALSDPLNNRGLVDANMMVNKYWLPDLVFGDGPTQSTMILLNSS